MHVYVKINSVLWSLLQAGIFTRYRADTHFHDFVAHTDTADVLVCTNTILLMYFVFELINECISSTTHCLVIKSFPPR